MSKAEHGTRSRYDAGCRCDACREANRRYRREHHARGGAEAGGRPQLPKPPPNLGRWREVEPTPCEDCGVFASFTFAHDDCDLALCVDCLDRHMVPHRGQEPVSGCNASVRPSLSILSRSGPTGGEK